MADFDYRMSFTSGGLFYQESIVLVELYLELKDWEQVRLSVLENNRLQTRTRTAAERLLRDMLPRLMMFSEAQLELFLHSAPADQGQMLWWACCQFYRFVKEFAVEVVREKFLRFDYRLTAADYDQFFEKKALWSERLDSLTKSTRERNRLALFSMLKEAGIINAQKQIQPVLLGDPVISLLGADSPESYKIFPISEVDIQRMAAHG